MNNQRRNQIKAIVNQIQDLQNDLENILSDEQDYYDNMPESFQGGEKGERSQSAIDCLEAAKDYIGDVISNLDEASE